MNVHLSGWPASMSPTSPGEILTTVKVMPFERPVDAHALADQGALDHRVLHDLIRQRTRGFEDLTTRRHSSPESVSTVSSTRCACASRIGLRQSSPSSQ